MVHQSEETLGKHLDFVDVDVPSDLSLSTDAVKVCKVMHISPITQIMHIMHIMHIGADVRTCRSLLPEADLLEPSS